MYDIVKDNLQFFACKISLSLQKP